MKRIDGGVGRRRRKLVLREETNREKEDGPGGFSTQLTPDIELLKQTNKHHKIMSEINNCVHLNICTKTLQSLRESGQKQPTIKRTDSNIKLTVLSSRYMVFDRKSIPIVA